MAAGGFAVCREVAVAMFDCLVMQLSGLLVRKCALLKSLGGRQLRAAGPFVCFGGALRGQFRVIFSNRLMCLEPTVSATQFRGPLGCLLA